MKVITVTLTKDPALEAKLDRFMTDFEDRTEQTFMTRGRSFDMRVLIECRPFNGAIRINDIMTFDPKTGAGTEALKFLIGLADKHGVRLEGTAKAYHNSQKVITDTGRLKQWYQKHGFVVIAGTKRDGYEIRYTPAPGHG